MKIRFFWILVIHVLHTTTSLSYWQPQIIQQHFHSQILKIYLLGTNRSIKSITICIQITKNKIVCVRKATSETRFAFLRRKSIWFFSRCFSQLSISARCSIFHFSSLAKWLFFVGAKSIASNSVKKNQQQPIMVIKVKLIRIFFIIRIYFCSSFQIISP